MSFRTPLLVFTYRRPIHTARALRALSTCAGLGKCSLVIYCDGPKSAIDLEAVEENRKVAKLWAARLHGDVFEATENRGLARSIVTAVSNHLSETGRVIVLEDDLVPAPDFIEFMLAGLEKFANCEEIAQISGCLLPGSLESSSDGVFLPLTTTWGWATWQRAWRDFRDAAEIDPIELERDRAFAARFTVGGAAEFYKNMLADRLAGSNDSWGILWWFAVARSGKLVLYPKKSLIWNGGFDSSGIHCGGSQDFEPEPPLEYQVRRLQTPIEMPPSIAVDVRALSAVQRYLSDGLAQHPQAATGQSSSVRRLFGSAKRFIYRQARK